MSLLGGTIMGFLALCCWMTWRNHTQPKPPPRPPLDWFDEGQ